jgi:uncharacterized protein YbcV (DUF1398 family)
MYWTLDKKENKPGLYKNREDLAKDFKGRIKKPNLNYHFSECKKKEVVINDVWIVRF